MRNPLYELYRKRGRKQGLEKGLVQGRAQGRELGREELIRDLFERRLGRRLSAAERRNLSELLAKDGVKTVSAALIEMSVEELASCIAPLGLRLPKPKGHGANGQTP